MPELYIKDGIHLNEKGQKLWDELIKIELDKITKGK